MLVLSVFSASSSYHCVALVLHVIVGLQALPINAFPAIDIIVFFADAVVVAVAGVARLVCYTAVFSVVTQRSQLSEREKSAIVEARWVVRVDVAYLRCWLSIC